MATVRYLVHDVDACLPFYEAIGFELAERWGPPFAMIRKGDLDVWLSGPGTSAAKPLSDGTIPSPGGWNRLVVEVEALDDALATLADKGATVRSEPVSGPGGRQALLTDPSGNPVELFEVRSDD